MAGVPPLKNSAYTFDVCLVSQADTDIFKTSVTLAAGDIQVSKDGGSFSNITTLPTEISTTGVLPVALTATEMNADRVTVRFHDAAGDEWQDLLVSIETETVQINDLATATALQTVDDNVDAILVDTGTTLDGKLDTIDGIVDSILVDTGTDIPAALTTIDNFLDTEIAAILEDTGTTLPATLTTIEGKIDTVDNFLDTEVAAILEDTGTTLPATLTTIEGKIDTADAVVDAILVDTDVTIPGLIAALNNLSAAEVNAEVVDALQTDTIPDSYSVDGAQPTISQAILAIHQFLYERAVSGTTMTVYKPNGTTVAITLTLDDATSPTSYSRSA